MGLRHQRNLKGGIKVAWIKKRGVVKELDGNFFIVDEKNNVYVIFDINNIKVYDLTGKLMKGMLVSFHVDSQQTDGIKRAYNIEQE